MTSRRYRVNAHRPHTSREAGASELFTPHRHVDTHERVKENKEGVKAAHSGFESRRIHVERGRDRVYPHLARRVVTPPATPSHASK